MTDDPIVRYRSRTPRSARLDDRAVEVFPGGDTRTAAFHLPYPLTIVSAVGPHLFDADGNRYLDLLGNYTALIHGNAYPPIVEAASRQLGEGSAWPARNHPQVELAEELCARVGSVERLRFANSGTEATMLALYLARAATGRSKVLMARSGYHGSLEEFEVGTVGREGPDTHIAEYGDAASFEAKLREFGPEIAAVILEPVLGSGGCISAAPGFYQAVEAAARAAGSLFVLDEVITLRLGVGGAQAALGVTPDLTAMGKIIGGGLPIGAVGGRADLFDATDPTREGGPALLHSGTFNGNPVSTAAGLVSMQHLDADRIDALSASMDRLLAGLIEAADAASIPFSFHRAGSLANLFLSETPPRSVRDRSDGATIGAFHLAALEHGLFFAPRGLIATSTVLTDQLVDEAVERFGRVFDSLAGIGEGR